MYCVTEVQIDKGYAAPMVRFSMHETERAGPAWERRDNCDRFNTYVDDRERAEALLRRLRGGGKEVRP